MIFINKNADYSANSIGQIEIPIELDPTAVAIMQKYTKTLSSKKQIAFSQLITGMKESGIYDKIEFMFLPFLAGTVSEAFYEIINNVTQDLSDTSTYGQYSLTSNGLKSVYDSEHSYTNMAIIITRSTYGCTISSLFHASNNPTSYVYYYGFGGTGFGVNLRSPATSRKYFVTSSSGQKFTTDTFSSNILSANSLVHSIITDTNSWLPSASTSKAICNGEVATTTTAIDSAMSVNKQNAVCLASYLTYGTSFQCNNGSLDALIISKVLDGVMCADDNTKAMSTRMDELLTAFKTSFFV